MISSQIADLPFEDYLSAVAEFTATVLIPGEQELERTGAVPETTVAAMAELGLFGISIPRTFGGLECSMEDQVRLTLEFTRASAVYRSRFSTVIGLCSQGLLDFATDDQKAALLPAMAAGQRVTAFGLTEPQAGSDAQALATTAVREPRGWVINGGKCHITNGAWADTLLIFARTTEGAGISCFIVDRQTPGVTTRAAEVMNGHEAGPVAEIDLVDVRVPEKALVGATEGIGMKMALRGINHARLHVAATAVGQTTRMLEETVAHLGERVQFGAPLAELGVVQNTLGDCFAQLEAGRALVLEAARQFDDGVIARHRISAAKLYCTEAASRVADECVQLLGGKGIVGPHPVARMWRDVRGLRIYEGSSPIHRRNLGRAMISQASRDGRLPDTYRV